MPASFPQLSLLSSQFPCHPTWISRPLGLGIEQNEMMGVRASFPSFPSFRLSVFRLAWWWWCRSAKKYTQISGCPCFFFLFFPWISKPLGLRIEQNEMMGVLTSPPRLPPINGCPRFSNLATVGSQARHGLGIEHK